MEPDSLRSILPRRDAREAAGARPLAPVRAGSPIAHIDFIDGLRAVAVLSVLVCHLYAPLLPGGFAGVDVFFVISGFVVSASVSHLRDLRLHEFLAFFYARRMARIVPALLCFVIPMLVVSAMLIPPAWLSDGYQRPGLYALVGLSNFVLAKSGNAYFSPTAEFNPFTHTWSLGVEEQFYFAFPLLFFAWLSPRRRWVSTAVVSAASAASVAYAMRAAHAGQTIYYLPWGRLWELGLGVLAFQLAALRGRRPGPAPGSTLAPALAVVSLAAIGWGLWSARATAAPYPAVILPAAGTAGVLLALYRDRRGPAAWLLALPALRFIGRISYSLYLWHWGVFVIFRWTRGLAQPLDMALAVAISFGLAVLSYHFVENRFRQAARQRPRQLTLAAGAASIALAFGIGVQLQKHGDALSLSTVVRNEADWSPEIAFTHSDSLQCDVKQDPGGFAGGIRWTYARTRSCQQPVTIEHRVFLLGDSHAMHYRRLFTRLALETGATVYAYIHAGCSFLSFLPLAAAYADECTRYDRAAVDDILRNGRAGDIVVLSSLRTPRLMDQWAHLYRLEDAIAGMRQPQLLQLRHEQEAYGVEVARKMAERGLAVVFVAPSGLSPRVNYRCADWFNRMNPICSGGDAFPRATIDALRQPALESLSAIAAQAPNVSVWDPLVYLCPGDPCKSERNGKPLYFDSDHLSGYSNDLLYQPFLELAQRIDRRRAAARDPAASQ